MSNTLEMEADVLDSHLWSCCIWINKILVLSWLVLLKNSCKFIWNEMKKFRNKLAISRSLHSFFIFSHCFSRNCSLDKGGIYISTKPLSTLMSTILLTAHILKPQKYMIITHFNTKRVHACT
jgi:hypothetical protein